MFGQQDPMATDYKKDTEDLEKTNYFAPFMQMVKKAEQVKAPEVQQAAQQAAATQPSAKTAASDASSGQIWGDVGGAAVKGLAAVLTGIGTEAIKRESEERKAAAQAQSNVLSGRARIGTGVSQSKSDILSRLSSLLPIVRR